MGSRLRPPLGDMAIALACAVAASLETLSGNHNEEALPVYLVVGLAQTLPLAWRRLLPLPVLGWIAGVTILEAMLTVPSAGIGTFLGLLISCYSVAAYLPQRLALVGLAVPLPLIAFTNWRSGQPWYEDLEFAYGLIAGFWLVGRIVRSRQLLIDQLAARTDELRRSRDAEARAAAAEERARIAREMHDVLAHNLSVMVVQAEAGQALLDDPTRVGAALQTISSTGRAALQDLRWLLGALRDPARAETETAPAPTLERADVLTAPLRAAGFAVDLRFEGERRHLPATVDLTGYRILQEALTNVARHCGPTHVKATVRYGENEVTVEVVDDGPTADSSGSVADGAHHGLVGISERVAALGGRFQAGPSGPGFRVFACLPLPTAA